jgi:hypothetical protein
MNTQHIIYPTRYAGTKLIAFADNFERGAGNPVGGIREAAKCALTALCGVQKAHGTEMHPNMAKDVEAAIAGLREALNGKDGAQ